MKPLAGRHASRAPILFTGSGWLLIAVLLAGCQSVSQYVSPRIEGRVLDAQTHKPLAGAQVQRLSHNPGFRPGEPIKGGQLLMQPSAIFTRADGSFVVDSQKAFALFQGGIWYSVNLSFEHAGYQPATAIYTPVDATNTVDGVPLVKAGDILLVPRSNKIPATNDAQSTR